MPAALPTAATKVAGQTAGPVAAAAALAQVDIGGLDLVTVGAILIGLTGGAVLRAGLLIQHEEPITRIRRDLLVSGLGGVVNFIIAGCIVGMGDLMLFALADKGMPEFYAAGIAAVIGARGNKNLPWFAKRYLQMDMRDLDDEMHSRHPADKGDPQDGVKP